MSSKKQLLTESEMRRFMKLANIPVLKEGVYGEGGGQIPQDPRREETVRPGEGDRMAEAGMYEEDPMPEAEMGGEGGEGEEELELGDLEGGAEGAGGDKEAKFQELVSMLADLVGVDVEMDAGGEMGGMEAPEGDDMAEPEGDKEMSGAADEKEEEEKEEEEEEELEEAYGKHGEEEDLEEEEEKEHGKMEESAIVETVLARVTARLIAEAKKKKEEKGKDKKKMSAAEKMKAMKAAKDKKKKLEEANAPAPKATSSNGPKKGAGSATKGTFGVTSALRKDDKFVKGDNKGGDKMSDVSASAEHTVSHGKKNLATQGGNKKK